MKKRHFALLLTLTMLLSGCGVETAVSQPTAEAAEETLQDVTTPDSVSEETTLESTVDTTEAATEESGYFSNRDFRVEYDENDCTIIELNGDTVDCNDGSIVLSDNTITITKKGTYVLRGELNNGTIIVDIDKQEKAQIVLDNASIHSETCAAIYVLQADKVFLTTAEGTENTLSSGESFVAIDENNIDATVYSKEDLTLNGAGSLTITAPAGHGVVSKDELTITSGTYAITSGAHGLNGKDNVCIAGGTLNITSGKDGIQADNADDTSLGFVYIENGDFNITAEGDGISASGELHILDGNYNIITGGGSVNGAQQTSNGWGGFMGGFFGDWSNSNTTEEDESTSIKGIKSSGTMVLDGGTYTIDSADDTIHANAAVTINGGTYDLSSGDDGVHSDDALVITGGDLTVQKSYEGLEGLSIEITEGSFTIYATDDGLNAAGGSDQSGFGGMRGGDMFAVSEDSFINISGGTFYINASGDGIDSNGALDISGGDIIMSGPTQGDTAVLDYGSTGIISGGTFIGTGSAMMSVGFSADSTQGAIMVSASGQKGTELSLSDAEGNVLLSRTADQSFNIVILSCPEILQGETYTLTIDVESMEITMDSLVYGSSAMGGFGMFGGMGGGRGGMPQGNAPDMNSIPDMGAAPDMGTMPDMGVAPDMATAPDMGTMPDMGSAPEMGNMPDMGGMPQPGATGSTSGA